MTKYRLIPLLLGLLAVGALGCEESAPGTSASGAPAETTAAATPETVTIASNPAGAGVFLNGAELGKTPFEFKYRKKTELELRAEGHQPKTLTVEPGGEPTVAVSLDPLDEQALADEKKAVADAKRAERRKQIPGGPAPDKKRSGVGGLLDRTTDKVGGVVGVGGLGDRRERRATLARKGPRYKNVASAKRALKSGRLSRTEYDDTIWVLKNYRKRKISKAKSDYNAGRLSKSAYEKRIKQIDREYKGS